MTGIPSTQTLESLLEDVRLEWPPSELPDLHWSHPWDVALNGRTTRLTLRSYVYFVQSVDGGPIKIGYSTDLTTRIRALQTGCPQRLEMRWALPGNQHLEHHFHREFAEHRTQGEWYEPPDDEDILNPARELTAAMLGHFTGMRTIGYAIAAGMRALSYQPFTDLERLWRNGLKLHEISDLAGLTVTRVMADLKKMRNLGFDVPYRYTKTGPLRDDLILRHPEAQLPTRRVSGRGAILWASKTFDPAKSETPLW